MPELMQRHDVISYDGLNAVEVLEFFSPVHGDASVWSVDSEADGVLVLRCDLPAAGVPIAGPPPLTVEVGVGEVFTRATDPSGNSSFQGPWPPEQFAAAFAEVPTVAELDSLQTALDALSARVAALEPTEQET